MRLAAIALLLTACSGPELGVQSSPLAIADECPCPPVTVDTADLTDEQLCMVTEAVKRWNDAASREVLELVDADGDVTVSGEAGPLGGVSIQGDVIMIGDAGADFVYSVEHLLGTMLGLPDDELEGSVMDWELAPGGFQVLPEHVDALAKMSCEAVDP